MSREQGPRFLGMRPAAITACPGLRNSRIRNGVSDGAV